MQRGARGAQGHGGTGGTEHRAGPQSLPSEREREGAWILVRLQRGLFPTPAPDLNQVPPLREGLTRQGTWMQRQRGRGPDGVTGCTALPAENSTAPTQLGTLWDQLEKS